MPGSEPIHKPILSKKERPLALGAVGASPTAFFCRNALLFLADRGLQVMLPSPYILNNSSSFYFFLEALKSLLERLAFFDDDLSHALITSFCTGLGADFSGCPPCSISATLIAGTPNTRFCLHNASIFPEKSSKKHGTGQC